MLTHLSIRNYALIDDLKVDFEQGFSTITGETGAGKSILLQSLGLVLGKRADRTALRDEDAKCVIEAEFAIGSYEELRDFFREEDLDYEDQTVLRREIRPNGKSRAFINDTPATLDVLQELGSRLIDIHSQHQTLELTQRDFQLRVVDALADNRELLVRYETLRDAFKRTASEVKSLKEAREASFKEQDYNEFLLNELEEANLRSGMQEELEEEQGQLSHAGQIIEFLGEAHQLMDQEEMGMRALLASLRQISSRLYGFGKRFESLDERVQSLYIEADDISGEFERLAAEQETDPARLEAVNDRLQALYDLLKKHNAGGVEELVEIRETLQKHVGDTAGMDQRIEELEALLETQNTELTRLAEQLTQRRSEVLPDFVKRLQDELSRLGMPNAAFRWEMEPLGDFGPRGRDAFHLLFTANRGGNFGPLKKTASGGELSRIMLIIKGILSSYEKLPAMIFDEIDTGVSGEISARMGDIMQGMSRHMQVIAITHLPQVASKGDRQYKVFKEDVDQKTHTRIRLLDPEQRIQELALMLGGDQASDAAITHARELLN